MLTVAKNNIHGGINNFSHKIWNAEEIKGNDFYRNRADT